MASDTPVLNELIAEWEKDSKIDATNPGGEILRIPILHSKYNKWLSRHKLYAAKTTSEYDKLYNLKWMYYNGKLSQQELVKLNWEPFRHTILKPDIHIFIDADQEMIDLKSKVTFHEECVSFCTYVMKELASRSYEIRAWMDWEKFEQGVK